MTEKEIKLANELHFAVKGHLIPEAYSEKDVEAILNGYMKRLWGNHERMTYCSEDFENEWSRREEIAHVAILGYN